MKRTMLITLIALAAACALAACTSGVMSSGSASTAAQSSSTSAADTQGAASSGGTASAASAQSSTAPQAYTQIDQEAAKEMMARDDAHVILDVRRPDALRDEPDEREAGTERDGAPGAGRVAEAPAAVGRRTCLTELYAKATPHI